MRNGEAPLLRVREAAPLLGISISALYQPANAWLDTDGQAGMPAVRWAAHLDSPSRDDRLAAVGSDNGHTSSSPAEGALSVMAAPDGFNEPRLLVSAASRALRR